jgi:transcription termination factor Rho
MKRNRNQLGRWSVPGVGRRRLITNPPVSGKQALDHAGAEALEEEERKVRAAVLRLGKEQPELLDDVRSTCDFSELLGG